MAELLSAEVNITAKLASAHIKDELIPLSVHSPGALSSGSSDPPSPQLSQDRRGAASDGTPSNRLYPAPRALDFSPEALGNLDDTSATSSSSIRGERLSKLAQLAALHAGTAKHGALYALLKTAAEALTLHPSATILPTAGVDEALHEATDAHVWAIHVLLRLTPVLRLMPPAVLHSIAAHPAIRHLCPPLVQAVLRQGHAQDSAVVPFPTPAADGGVVAARGYDALGRSLVAPRPRFDTAGGMSPLPPSPTASPSPPPAAPHTSLDISSSPPLVRSVSDAGTTASMGVAFDPDAAEESEVARHASISVQFVGAAEETDPLEQSRHLHRTREATAALMNRSRVKDTIQSLVRAHAASRSAFSSQSHTEYAQTFLSTARDTIQSLPSGNAAWFAGLLLGMLAAVAPAGTDLTHADSAVASMGSSSDAARLARLNERMADQAPAAPSRASSGSAPPGLQRIGKRENTPKSGAAARRGKGQGGSRRGSGSSAGQSGAAPSVTSLAPAAPGRPKGKTRVLLTPGASTPTPSAATAAGTLQGKESVPTVQHWLGKDAVMQGGRRVAGGVRFFQSLAAATCGSQPGEVLQATTMHCVHALSTLGARVDQFVGRVGATSQDGEVWCWNAACAQALMAACKDIPALQGAQTIMACASNARAAASLLAVLSVPALRAWGLCSEGASADAPDSTTGTSLSEPSCMLGFEGMLRTAASTGSLCVLVPAVLAFMRTAQHILAQQGFPASASALWSGPTAMALQATKQALFERISMGHRVPVTRSHLAVWLELHSLSEAGAPREDALHLELRRELTTPVRRGLDGTFAAVGMLGLCNAFPDLTSIHHKLSRLPLASRHDGTPLHGRDRKDSSGSLGSGFGGQRKKIRPVLISAPAPLSALGGIAEHSTVTSLGAGTGVSDITASRNAGKLPGATGSTQQSDSKPAPQHVLLNPEFRSKLVHGYLHRHSHVSAISDSVAPVLAQNCVKHCMATVVEATCRSALKMFHDEIAVKLSKASKVTGQTESTLPSTVVDGVWTLAVASAQKAAKSKVRAASEAMFLSAVQVAVTAACALPASVLRAAPAAAGKASPAAWGAGLAKLTQSGDDTGDAEWTEAQVAGQVAAHQSLSKLDNAVAQLVPVHTARRLAAERSAASKQYWQPLSSDATQ